MIANRSQKLLLMVTALVIVAGLLVIPSLADQEVDASKISEKLKKAQDKIKKSFDRVDKILNGDHDFHN